MLVSGLGVVFVGMLLVGMLLCMCLMFVSGNVASVGRRWRSASSLSSSDLLTVAILFRRCSRCVISGLGYLRYR